MKNLAITINLVIALCLLSTCGASQRETTIKTMLVSVNAARDGFLAFDVKHQTDIVDAATSVDDGLAKLAAYRKVQGGILLAFDEAYRALAIAAVLKDDPKSLPNLFDAAKRLKELLDPLINNKAPMKGVP